MFDILRDGLAAINAANGQLASAQQQVATGKRISGAGDDPLGTQQAIGEHTTLATLDAYTRTSDSAAARLASADNVLTAYSDKLTAALSTGLSAQGTQINPAARAAASQTIRSLRAALTADLNTTFNGSYLFSGTQAATPAYALVGGVWTYQGDNATTQVEVERGRTVSVSFDGQSIAKGSDTTDILTALDDLANAIDAGDNTAIGTGLDAVRRGFDRAQRAQGLLGSDEQGLDAAQARLSALKVAAEGRRSKLEDANMAEAVTKLTQADSAYRAALGAVSTAERQSLLDYLR
jgi:flagellar hook-associated protein 3 FlgL